MSTLIKCILTTSIVTEWDVNRKSHALYSTLPFPMILINLRKFGTTFFLANVNSRSRSLYAIARPSVVCLSVVCNVRAPYSGGWNFRQYFYGIRYLGHPL